MPSTDATKHCPELTWTVITLDADPQVPCAHARAAQRRHMCNVGDGYYVHRRCRFLRARAASVFTAQCVEPSSRTATLLAAQVSRHGCYAQPADQTQAELERRADAVCAVRAPLACPCQLASSNSERAIVHVPQVIWFSITKFEFISRLRRFYCSPEFTQMLQADCAKGAWGSRCEARSESRCWHWLAGATLAPGLACCAPAMKAAAIVR